ncbi:MAG: BON domain-containing protein [Methylobacter sp.]|uniref:BON domain-containing protein n=1 Tax=Methylobacter sp. TaxID=2051955 RepID=UPI00272F5D0C|nr:BON domain-containing protein [Methylobacter sp.]MDP1667124.1 BON domain-containing protein [Methylobacter sp.]
MKTIKACSAFFLALALTSIAGYGTAISGERMDMAAGGGQSAGDYIDDAVITTKVKAAIAADDNLSAFQINVETLKGVVQLSGFVDTHDEITRAAEVAQKVEGVKSVTTKIQLKDEKSK